MKQLSKNNYTPLFALLIGLLVVVAFISYNNILKFNKSVYLMNHSNLVKNKIVELVSNIKDAEIGHRGYLLTNNSVFLQSYNGAQIRSNQIFVYLNSLINDNPRQQQNLKKLKKLVNERYVLLNDNINLYKSKYNHADRASNLLKGKIKMDEVKKQAAFLLQLEDKILADRTIIKDRTASFTPIFLLVLSLFSIFIISLFFFRLQKEAAERTSLSESNLLLKEANEKIEASEMSFRTLAETIPHLVWTATPDGKKNFFNSYFYNYTGLSYEELKGDGWQTIIHPDDLKNELQQWHQILKTGQDFRIEKRIRKHDRTYRWYLSHSIAQRDNGGKIVGWIGTNTDITDRIETEEKLLKSEQQVRAMVQTAPFPIAVYIGKEMIIQFANQSFLNIWAKGNDVIGKPFKKILPELDNQEIFKQLDSVYNTGIPFHAKNQKIDIIIEGETTSFYFNYSFTPLIDADGTIYSIMNTAADVTELTLAKLSIQKSEENLRRTILKAPVAMCMFVGQNFIVDLANERMIELWGRSAEELLHKPIFKGLPEASDQGFEAILTEVYTSGKTFSAEGVPVFLPRKGAKEVVYLNYVFEPYREADGSISGILAAAIDVTSQQIASKKIEEREQKFRLLADSMPQFIWTSDAKGNLNYFNQSVYKYSGLGEDELIKEGGWLEIVHPEEREENIKKWLYSVSTGIDFMFEHRFRKYDGAYRWQLSRAKPQLDESGNIQMWVGTSTDIHDQKNFAQDLEERVKERTAELEERKNFVETILETTKELIAVYATDFTLIDLNAAVETMMGKKRKDLIGKKLLELMPNAKGSKAEADLQSAFDGNKIYNEPYQSPITGRYIENYVTPLKDKQGNVYAVIAIATDVTNIALKQKEVENANVKLQLQNQTFESAEKIAKFGSYKWNMDTGSLEYSDNLFRLLDCEPQEFVPSFEKFLSFIHPDDLEEVNQNGEETMKTGKLVETPYRIISKKGRIKHLRSSGSFSGEGINRLLIGTVQDITKDIDASKELKAKNIELENANAELSSFSYVASHDLQEPLRKIQGFSKRILDKEGENLSETTKDYFNRIRGAAQRMQNLIESLLNFSRTNLSEVVFEKTDLNKIIIEVEDALKEVITNKKAIIEYQNLPTFDAVPVQMQQLFLNLIGNALKYSKQDVDPVIKITAERASNNEIARKIKQDGDFWKISIIDNGIGFEQQYENKIFELFQRLHGKTEFEGTGIGLAICKKIVQAHNGTITATGKLGIGSTFTFYLSDNNKT